MSMSAYPRRFNPPPRQCSPRLSSHATASQSRAEGRGVLIQLTALSRIITSVSTGVDTDVIIMFRVGFVAYYRVSTDKQGRSGLGLEAQRQAVASYLKADRPIVRGASQGCLCRSRTRVGSYRGGHLRGPAGRAGAGGAVFDQVVRPIN